MTRTPLPRYRADVRLAIEISAADETEAQARLDEVVRFLAVRTERSTFRRLAGMPDAILVEVMSDAVPN